jgi:uncharacterized protein involved in exopolysaccharide biosynthesis
MGPIYSLADILDMLRRRVGVISAVVIAGCFASVYWALTAQDMFESSAVIQVERPQISDELVRSTVDGSSARRLQLIEQQLMSRDNLERMIAEYGIYDNLPALRLSEKVNILRQSVRMNGVAAVREGFSDDGEISILTITVEMGSPEKARDVANGIADQTRALAAMQRKDQTRETLEFFNAQESALIAEMARLDAELVAFRSANDLSIEGNLEFRRSELGSLNDAILELDREIITVDLQLENLDRSGGTRAATVEREEQELTRQRSNLGTQRELLLQRREDLSATIETTPEVERGLTEFERRRTQLSGQLDLITTRRTEAEVGFTLESAARGERFTTLEEARLPDFPITMSRKKRVIFGVAAATMLALVLAFLLELRRPVIRTARQMQRETGLMPVVSIPETGKVKHRRGLGRLWQGRGETG